MAGSDEPAVVDAAAAAILNGTPIDWPALDARASASERELLEELRLLCTVADLHRDFPSAEVDPAGEGPLPYWGRLRLIERIGGGSFGEVHRAWDPRLRREVALKLIELAGHAETDSAAIIREGRLLARVRHPGVVTIYDAERIGPRVGLSMEFVEGQTLEARIRERGTLSADETIDIGKQLASAVGAAHAAGVLHRDIKAANVIIRGDGRIVLMDFGAGRHVEDADGGATGTPMYLAPEVLAGGDATVRSDIYSLGVLMHYALTGRYPVEATSLAALREAHARRREQVSARSITGVGGRLGAVLTGAINPRPEARFDSAAAFEAALASVGASDSRGRRAMIGLTAAAAVVSVLLGGWWAGIGGGTPDPLRIAVLPFVIDDPRAEHAQSDEEMVRDLTSRLQTFDNARVISAGSSLSHYRRNLPPSGMAQELNADALLTGRTTRSGDLLRIEAEIIGSDARVWTRSYEGPASRRADLHADLIRDLAAELGLRRQAPGPRPLNPKAHALYVKGQVELDRMLNDSYTRALPLFLEALRLDPNYAQVHALMPELYLRTGGRGTPPSREQLQLASQSAARAMALDPLLPASHLADAMIKSAHGEWADANRSYQNAVRLGPGDVTVRVHYAHWLSRLGRFEQAIEHALVAKDLEPYQPRPSIGLASALRFARRWEESLAETNRLIELDPGYHIAYLNLAHSLQGLGRLDEAIAAFERYRQVAGSSGNLGDAYAEAGRVADARRLAAELESAERPRHGELAQLYAGLRDLDKAFEWLARIPPLGSVYPETLLVARVYDPLRSDPRFAEVLKRHRLDPASLSGF